MVLQVNSLASLRPILYRTCGCLTYGRALLRHPCGIIDLPLLFRWRQKSRATLPKASTLKVSPAFSYSKYVYPISTILLCTDIVLQGHTLLDRIVGADGQALTKSLDKWTAKPAVVPLSYTTQAPKTASHTAPGLISHQQEILTRLADVSSGPDASSEESPEVLEQRLRKLMTSHKIMLFMKGTSLHPHIFLLN